MAIDGDNINYSTSSSVIGLNEFAQNQVDFGASEIGYSTGQAAGHARRVPYQYLPDVAGATCLMYNLTSSRRADQARCCSTRTSWPRSSPGTIKTGTTRDPGAQRRRPAARTRPSSSSGGRTPRVTTTSSPSTSLSQPAALERLREGEAVPAGADAVFPFPHRAATRGSTTSRAGSGRGIRHRLERRRRRRTAPSPTSRRPTPSCTHKPCAYVENASRNYVQPDRGRTTPWRSRAPSCCPTSSRSWTASTRTRAERLPDLRLQLPDHRRRATETPAEGCGPRPVHRVPRLQGPAIGRNSSATRRCRRTSWRTTSTPSTASPAPPRRRRRHGGELSEPVCRRSNPCPANRTTPMDPRRPRRHRRQEHPRRRRRRQQPQQRQRRRGQPPPARPRPPGQLEPPRVTARKAPTEGSNRPRSFRRTSPTLHRRRRSPSARPSSGRSNGSRQILQRHELHAGLGSGSAPVGRHSPGNSAIRRNAAAEHWEQGRNASLPTTNCFCDRRSLFWSRPHLRCAEPRHDDRGRFQRPCITSDGDLELPREEGRLRHWIRLRDDSLQLPYLEMSQRGARACQRISASASTSSSSCATFPPTTAWT